MDSDEKTVADQLWAMGQFIASGKLTRFDQLFRYMSKTKCARVFGITPSRFRILQEWPEEFKQDEIKEMARLLQIEPELLERFLKEGR